MPFLDSSVESYDGTSGAILESLPRILAPIASLQAAQRDYPILARALMNAGQPLDNTRLEMHQYRAIPRKVDIVGAESATDTTIRLSLTDAAYIRVGDILLTPNRELMKVTAISSTDLTVTRGFGNSSAGVITTGDTLTILTNGRLEGSAFSAGSGHTPVVKYNYTQNFKREIQISGTLADMVLASTLPGTAALQSAIEAELENMKIIDEMAGALISGSYDSSTPQGSATVQRYMDGLFTIAARAQTAGEGSSYVSVASTDFNSSNAFDNLMNHIRDYVTGGGSGRVIAAGAYQHALLSRFMKDVQRDGNITSLSMAVDSFRTPFGTFGLQYDTSVPDDAFMIYNPSKIRWRWVRGRELRLDRLPTNADALQWHILGEGTIHVQDGYTGDLYVGYGAALS